MPDNNAAVQKVILTLLAALPLIGWLVFIGWAGLAEHGAGAPPDIPDNLRLAGVASGAALATIAGAFLGIKQEQQRSLVETAQTTNLGMSAFATIVYFGGLVVAVLIWAFDSNRAFAAEVVQTSLATLFGFGIGALKATTTPPTGV